MDDGQPRYVTACSQSDVVDGWRDRRGDGGCVLDVTSGKVVVSGLSMPHSPRLHRGRLWLLNSGCGEFGWVIRCAASSSRWHFVPVTAGLGDGGQIRRARAVAAARTDVSGLVARPALAQRQATARCGLLVVDLDSGDVVHWLRIEGTVQELYDVAILPGVVRPKALGFKTNEIRRSIWFHAEGRPILLAGAR